MVWGVSFGVSTNTTNQSVLKRPASREPLRSSAAARGDDDDRHTITRLRGELVPLPASATARAAALARSTLSATSRSASSRRWARFWSLKKCSSAQGILSAA